MKTSPTGIALIKEFESCRLTAYKCPAGVWTIGYGHTSGVKSGQVINKETAEHYLIQDLKQYESYVTALHMTLNQNQFDALVSFTYNCGPGNLKKLVHSRTMEQIADAMLMYNKSNGKVLAGLTRRRQVERNLFLQLNVPDSPVTPAENAAIYYPAYIPNEPTLDNIMASIGADKDYDSGFKNYVKRHKIAEANGILNYKGTAQQNIKLMTLARDGKLKRPGK